METTLIVVASIVMGLLIGSFLTVVVDRVPRGASIVAPPSMCGACYHRLTAPDLVQLGICDEIVPEAPGGAHRNHALTASNLRSAIKRQLRELSCLDPETLVRQRYEKFRKMGASVEQSS